MQNIARPSNLPGKNLEPRDGLPRLSLCKPRGRKAKPGPCAKCGTEGRLITGLCRRCYGHRTYLARPGVAKRIAERVARRAIKKTEEEEKLRLKIARAIKKEEKQLRGEKWRAAHPQKENKKEASGKESPAWVQDWLRHQAENYLRENAGHFDRNGIRLWVMTEEQVIGLCRIIYMAVSKHSSAWHKLPIDEHQRKAWWNRAEGDGSYLDRSVSPELRGAMK